LVDNGGLVEAIENWRGETIRVVRSRGGVIACEDPFANLLIGQVSPWPPPELVQKLYMSRQVNAFDKDQRSTCTSALEYYCDLQSLNSEDALTWSCFGPVIHGEKEQQLAFTSGLFSVLGLSTAAPADVGLWLWRRIPHPESLVPGGPEIDVGIQTATVLVFGEAKWRSPVGSGQGRLGDKDQIQLRMEFCQKYGPRLYPQCRDFVVLSIGVADEESHRPPARLSNGSVVSHQSISWSLIAELPGHPQPSEIRSYVAWKARVTLGLGG
jgi:hypothetical protein